MSFNPSFENIAPENQKRFFVVDHNAQDQFSFPNQPRQNEPDLVSFDKL